MQDFIKLESTPGPKCKNTTLGSQETTGSSEAPPQHQATGKIIHSSGPSNNHFLQSGPQMLWHWQHYPDDKSQTTSVI